jgi:hypothetical protein
MWPPILTARTLCWCAGIQSLRQGPIFREVAIQVCIMMLLNGQKVDTGPFKLSNKIYWVTKVRLRCKWWTVRLRCKWRTVRPADGWDFEKIDKRWARNADDLSHGTATCWTWFKTNYVTNVGVPKRYCISNKLTKSDPQALGCSNCTNQ